MVPNSLLGRLSFALATFALFLWEWPWLRRLVGLVTGFDFLYERTKDPSWVAEVLRMALNPPPGTALLVAAIGLVLIYWSTKPKVIRMSWPVLGMLASAICLAGFAVWYLVTVQFEGPRPLTAQEAASASQAAAASEATLATTQGQLRSKDTELQQTKRELDQTKRQLAAVRQVQQRPVRAPVSKHDAKIQVELIDRLHVMFRTDLEPSINDYRKYMSDLIPAVKSNKKAEYLERLDGTKQRVAHFFKSFEEIRSDHSQYPELYRILEPIDSAASSSLYPLWDLSQFTAELSDSILNMLAENIRKRLERNSTFLMEWRNKVEMNLRKYRQELEHSL